MYLLLDCETFNYKNTNLRKFFEKRFQFLNRTNLFIQIIDLNFCNFTALKKGRGSFVLRLNRKTDTLKAAVHIISRLLKSDTKGSHTK